MRTPLPRYFLLLSGGGQAPFNNREGNRGRHIAHDKGPSPGSYRSLPSPEDLLASDLMSSFKKNHSGAFAWAMIQEFKK